MEAVCKQVRWKQAHSTISRDLSDHIEDQAEVYTQEGMEACAAAERAVKDMGDPIGIGLLLDASYRPKIEWSMLILLGLMVLSGMVVRLLFYQLSVGEWIEYAAALGAGALCFVGMLQMNFYRMLKGAWYFQIAFFLITIVIPYVENWLFGKGTHFLAETAWLQALWMLYPPIYAFAIYRMRGSGFLGLIATGALLAVPLLLRLYMPDPITVYEMIAISSCFVVTIVAIWLKCYRCNRLLAFAVTSIVTIGGIFVIAIWEPYRFARILGTINPANDPLGDGYLSLCIRELVQNATWFGRGKALSEATQYFVENSNQLTSNFALTRLIYEFGYSVLAALCGFVFAFLMFAFARVRRIGSQLGKLLAVSVLVALTAQSILYIASCVGYPMMSSSALPFILGNNLFVIFDYILLGLLLSLFRTDALFADTVPRQWKRLHLHISVTAQADDR